ncbi:NADPH-dependent FMN reductase [Enterococcus sp. HY326]|uniref:NADPH-dependent FMN reductase n=1 Tax=Enterococcus sp. HY326 TaxID=2971265 RepID=UPI00223F5924|nr:NADPH-dependent FMN reductase [Enterococcus sp. HY326]
MKIALLSSSIVGSKTRNALAVVEENLKTTYPEAEVTLLDLKNLNLQFSDGRNYMDYTGDTGLLTKTLMDAEVIIIATPTYQASIPGTLKNIFDLLPQKAFYKKTVSFIITAGSAKHFLVAENQLKPILSYMKANLLPYYVFIEESDIVGNQIINDDVIFRLRNFVQDTMVLSKTYQAIWQEEEEQYDF